VAIDPALAEKFSEVYDRQDGQGKVAAWTMIERNFPELAGLVKTFGDQLGGGSLYTVFDVTMDNGRREAWRVLNPNADYLTDQYIKVMRASQEALVGHVEGADRAGKLLDLIEQWIHAEMHDETYEADDRQMRSDWNGWKPGRWNSGSSIYIPQSYETGSPRLRRDEYVPGQNMTEFLARTDVTEAQKKEYVALGYQFYLQQVQGKTLSNVLGVLRGQNDSVALVHSDISPGNYRVTENGALALLDRGMYLKLTLDERRALGKIAEVASQVDKAKPFVDLLCVYAENKGLEGREKRLELEAAIAARLRSATMSPEQAAIMAVVTAQEYGAYVPLHLNLLLKNFNAWARMARSAGFANLDEARTYQPSQP
jgi:predicted unusual protein kinase regulating ubiquinone biosynthesis (AarF/ABC1/UbiB family)